MKISLRDENGRMWAFDFAPPLQWRKQNEEFLTAHPTGLPGPMAKVFIKRYPIKSPAPAGGLLRSMIGRPVANTPHVYAYAADKDHEYHFFQHINGGKTFEELLAAEFRQYLETTVLDPAFLTRLVDEIALCLKALNEKQWTYADFSAKNIFLTKEKIFLIDLDSAVPNTEVRHGKPPNGIDQAFWALWLEFKLPGPLMATQLASFSAILGMALSTARKGANDERTIDFVRERLRNPSFGRDQRKLWNALKTQDKGAVHLIWNLPENADSDSVYSSWRELFVAFERGDAKILSVQKAASALFTCIGANVVPDAITSDEPPLPDSEPDVAVVVKPPQPPGTRIPVWVWMVAVLAIFVIWLFLTRKPTAPPIPVPVQVPKPAFQEAPVAKPRPKLIDPELLVDQVIAANEAEIQNTMLVAATGSPTDILAAAQNAGRRFNFLSAPIERNRGLARKLTDEGKIYFDAVNYLQARTVQLQAFRADPQDTEVVGNLAMYALLVGDAENARRYALYALALPRSHQSAGRIADWQVLAAAYAAAGDANSAKNALYVTLAISTNIPQRCQQAIYAAKNIFGTTLREPVQAMIERVQSLQLSDDPNCALPIQWE